MFFFFVFNLKFPSFVTHFGFIECIMCIECSPSVCSPYSVMMLRDAQISRINSDLCVILLQGTPEYCLYRKPCVWVLRETQLTTTAILTSHGTLSEGMASFNWVIDVIFLVQHERGGTLAACTQNQNPSKGKRLIKIRERAHTCAHTHKTKQQLSNF